MTDTLLRIPTLRAGTLTLRAAKPSDFGAYLAFRLSERSRYVGGPYTREEAVEHFAELTEHWAKRGYGRWVVADAETDAPLGVVGLFYPDDWPEPEIAWALFEAAEGRGVAYEAALAARRYAYETLGWTTVISMIVDGNDRSVALAKRLGAHYERDFDHPEYGSMQVWRHAGPEAAA